MHVAIQTVYCHYILILFVECLKYRKLRKFRGVKLCDFSIVVQKLNFVVFMVATVNRNAKVQSIGKIETEMTNVTGTGLNHIKVFLQLQPPS